MFGRLDIQSYIGTCKSVHVSLSLKLTIDFSLRAHKYRFLASLCLHSRHLWPVLGDANGSPMFHGGSAISTGANSMPVLLIGRGVAGVGAAALLSVR